MQEKDDEDEEEYQEEGERDGRGNQAGVVQSEASTGGAEYLRPLPRSYLLRLSSSPFSPRGWNHRHLQRTPPLSTFFLLLHKHLPPPRRVQPSPLLLSEAPAAPGGYPRQVAARDSHGMSGDRYVRPDGEDIHGRGFPRFPREYAYQTVQPRHARNAEQQGPARLRPELDAS